MTAIDVSFIPGMEVLFDPKPRYIVFAGGRASGKSLGVGRRLLLKGTEKVCRILCCRELQKSIAESVHALLKAEIEIMGLSDFYEVQNNSIIGRNGTEFFFFGLRANIDQVKSTYGVTDVWLEEAQNISTESWLALDPTIRAPGAQFFIVYNPRFATDVIHVTFADPETRPPNAVYKVFNWRDNPFFPPELETQRLHLERTNPLMYRHVYEGEIVPNLTTALWSWDAIDQHRLPPGTEVHPLRTVVAIDPAVTANKRSDETGIVAASVSMTAPRHYYVLADASGRYQPEAWARRALEVYDRVEADAIVGEVNQGGDMVETTLRNACANLGRPMPKFVPVRASKGKVVRAEPIAALYADGLVHHMGRFPELERQLLTYNPADPDAPSPDRMDALVWALTELSTARPPLRIAQEALARLTGRR